LFRQKVSPNGEEEKKKTKTGELGFTENRENAYASKKKTSSVTKFFQGLRPWGKKETGRKGGRPSPGGGEKKVFNLVSRTGDRGVREAKTVETPRKHFPKRETNYGTAKGKQGKG